MIDAEERSLLERLISKECTKKTVRPWLEDRELPVSLSWPDLFARIWPAVEENLVTRTDLVRLLGWGEEYGRQHIFLFKPRRGETKVVDAFLEDGWLEQAVEDAGLGDVFEDPRALDLPETPTWSDLRREFDLNGKPTLVLKEVMRRRHMEEKVQQTLGDGTQHILRRPVFTRAVNVAQLRSGGRLEIRLAAVKTGHRKYAEELEAFQSRISDILPIDLFERLSLAKLKDYLYERRFELAEEIYVRGHQHCDELGVRISAEDVGTYGKSLIEHETADAAVVAFAQDGTYCESHNLYFEEREPLPEERVHVRIPRSSNELIIPAKCTKHDYEHVMGRLHSLARAASR